MITKKRNSTQQPTIKKTDRKTFLIISALAIINLISFYLQPKIIGHNSKYILYFFAGPVAAGVIALACFFRKLLAKEFTSCVAWSDKILVPFFYLLAGLFYSYLTFGWAGNITWVYLNEKAAQKFPSGTITCKVNSFEASSSGSRISSSAKMYFTFQNRSENFSISNAMYNEYKDSSAKKYQLKIEGRKGLWNYFIVDSYSLEEAGK